MESVAADPTALEDQLSRVRALNNELVSGSRLIDSTKQVIITWLLIFQYFSHA